MKHLSIKSYALSFILLYVLVFIISSTIAFLDLQKLNKTISQTHYDSGQAELIDTINTLVNNNKTITNKFAAWDEVHQQINQPDYYHYWQTHRLFNSDILPDNFSEASIYDISGKILGRLSKSSLPDHITLSSIEPYFNIEDSIPALITISRIVDQDNEKKTLGYVATKSFVLASLLRIRQFNHIDSQSIKVRFPEKKFIKVSEFINYLDFNIKQNDEILQVIQQFNNILIRNTFILIGFALIFYYLMSYFLSRPLREISAYIDALNNNPEFQYVPELGITFHIQELEKVRDSITQYQNKLQAVYSNLDDKNKELWDMAHHDALTGAFNRRAFEDHWAKIAELFSESRFSVSLILFDVNHFKSINDSYGHPVGDEILRKIADTIQQILRKGEKLYRIGGDEFATILQTYRPEDALYVANRCNKAISEISFSAQGIKEPIRASIGVAHNNLHDPGSISDLLWQADVAVYSAKKPGHSHVVTYSEEIKSISGSILSSKINSLVFDAIESSEGITMFYQPVVNLDNEKIEYYEALLRIQKQGEIIPPGEIFELIAARKLDFELDIAIFKQIANDLTQGIIPDNSGVSINVSGPSIINHQIIKQLSIFVPFLSQYKIVIEITETSLITNINHAAGNISKLKELGFLIALDDFGSGYSSISYLSSMPVDIVKFDISLIRQLDDDKQLSIISHLAMMIRETGHLLVAEGIETEDRKEKIKDLGFNYAQGYLYGRPAALTVL